MSCMSRWQSHLSWVFRGRNAPFHHRPPALRLSNLASSSMLTAGERCRRASFSNSSSTRISRDRWLMSASAGGGACYIFPDCPCCHQTGQDLSWFPSLLAPALSTRAIYQPLAFRGVFIHLPGRHGHAGCLVSNPDERSQALLLNHTRLQHRS